MIQKKTNLFQLYNKEFHTPSLSHARAQQWSTMLSLGLGGIVVQSQIPTKFIPIQPKSVIKSVNKEKQFSCAPYSFQAGALLSQQKQS